MLEGADVKEESESLSHNVLFSSMLDRRGLFLSGDCSTRIFFGGGETVFIKALTIFLLFNN